MGCFWLPSSGKILSQDESNRNRESTRSKLCLVKFNGSQTYNGKGTYMENKKWEKGEGLKR